MNAATQTRATPTSAPESYRGYWISPTRGGRYYVWQVRRHGSPECYLAESLEEARSLITRVIRSENVLA